MLEDHERNNIKFKKRGKSFWMGKDYKILNPKYISIGENFYAQNRVKINAIERFANFTYEPKIIIGNNVSLMDDIHIGCIDHIEIDDGCLIASHVYISDHSHGDITAQALLVPPIHRPLVSKGPVKIGKNVWIGHGVAILPNVTIGNNCIIGSNSVVTKSFPDSCVIAGAPAKIIKQLN